jgi:hypothetical protein
MDIVRTVVRDRGWIHDPKLGWVRQLGFGDPTMVTAVIERLGGNPRQRRLREAVSEALRTVRNNPDAV